jgi:hypothetical protein
MIASFGGFYDHSRSRPRHHAYHVDSHAPKVRNASHGLLFCFVLLMLPL